VLSINYKTVAVKMMYACALSVLMLLKDLIEELKSELSGNFSHTITSLCKSPAERDADELRKAMKVASSTCVFKNFLLFFAFKHEIIL